MTNTTIKQWAEDDRPREKMLLKGPDSLSNAELIAILINNGTKDKTAVDLAKELLSKVDNNLLKLGKMSVKEIRQLKVKGVGNVKAISIAAALELGARRDATEKKIDIVASGKDVANFLQSKLQHKKHEVFAVLFLNKASKITHYEIIGEGGISMVTAEPRSILKLALDHDATNVILCHNHPSGNTKPSAQDEILTQKIKDAARLFDIQIVDHIIVSDEGFYSFADAGIL
jgi:DNA repair protein RadC